MTAESVPAPLTVRELAALGFLRRYISGVGYAPSVRDLAEEFGMSLSGAHYVLQGLVAKGAIRRDPKVPRGLVILDPETVTDVPVVADGRGSAR